MTAELAFVWFGAEFDIEVLPINVEGARDERAVLPDHRIVVTHIAP
jgi:hypothetical protein